MPRASVLIALVTALAGCPPPTKGTGPGTTTTSTTTTTTTTTTSTTTTVTDPGVWTRGPALPACTPVTGDPNLIALSGVVLLPTGAVAGHVVVDQTTGTIACAGSGCNVGNATVVCTEGVISPAFIDTHDHTQYNVLAPWRHSDLYETRYEWQSDGDYWDYREAYDEIAFTHSCEIVKWAELRQIVGGATSVVGSTGGTCIDVLARNLDEDDASHGVAGYELAFSASNVFYYDETDAADRLDDLRNGGVDVFLDHVAEGINGRVTSEIEEMFNLGMTGPGSVFVHATDATVSQLARMAASSTSLIWSPRSNLDLYADTTKADLAARLGVPMAIGPDWTWSGSSRLTQELTCARQWLAARNSPITDIDLFDMITLDASVVLGLQGQLGMLVPGAKADISVFPWRSEPYRAIIEAEIEDVHLVLIDGMARYGTPALVAGLELDPSWCESVTACSEQRTICVQEGASGWDSDTYSDLESYLAAGLSLTPMPQGLEYASELYPLWACDEVRPTCDPRSPTPTDQDGDGINDSQDSCPAAYDPDGLDLDGDGIGDVCDPCPLSPQATCVMSPDDIDDDGIENGNDACPWVYDPGNPDRDNDGHGDACDPCPLDANPGALGCPASIRAIRDPNHPSHPADGAVVTVFGATVTGVGTAGFFVQDPLEADFGGIYVFGASTVSVGDVVDVTGEVAEYFGLSELISATATVTGVAPLPAPIVINPCNIGTGGADAERYESMLVEVAAVSVTDANPDAPSDFNEFEVAGCLRVDDLLCPTCWVDQPIVGTNYGRITGPLTYSFSNSKIVPRDLADLQ